MRRWLWELVTLYRWRRRRAALRQLAEWEAAGRVDSDDFAFDAVIVGDSGAFELIQFADAEDDPTWWIEPPPA